MKKALAFAVGLLLTSAGLAHAQGAIAWTSGGTGSGGTTITFAGLGTQPNGTFYYCSDCQLTTPCQGGGTGAFAFKVAGAWTCANTSGAAGTDNTVTDDSLNVGNGAISQVKALANGVLSYATATNTFSAVLGNVENTALSTWAGTANVTTLGTITPPFILGATATYDQIRIVPSTKNANAFTGSLTSADLTGNRTWALPDADATLVAPTTCTGTDKVSAITSQGAVTCTTDGGGSAGTTTDDNINLGNGSTSDSKAIPACTDVTGNHLNYDAATNTFSCGTSGGGGVADPGGNGIMVRTASNVSIARSIVSPGGTAAIVNASGVDGNIGIDSDPTIHVYFSLGAAPPAANCDDTGMDLFKDRTGHKGYFCSNTNTWQRIASPTGETFTGVQDFTGAEIAGASPFVLEGSSADGNETTVAVTNPTADRTFTIPNADSVAIQPSTCTSGDYVSAVSAAGAITCGTPAGGGGTDFNPATMLDIYDEFPAGLGTTGNIGSYGWIFTAHGTGTFNWTAASSLAHYGIAELKSHATNDDSGVTLTLVHSSNTGGINDWTVGDWKLELLFQMDSVTTDAFYFGLASTYNQIMSTTAKAIMMRYEFDATDTNFTAQLCDASGAAGCASAADAADNDVTATSQAAAAATWYLASIRQAQVGVGGARTLYFRVSNGAGGLGTEVTACASGCDMPLTNAPSGSYTLYPQVSFVTRAASNQVNLSIDYFRLHATGLTRY